MNNSQQDQPLIAALYARVSTARQEEQETIESQIEEIKKRILDDGNILPTENVFQDDGWTGEMLQRPGLDAMRDASVANSFQVLYVYDRGRLSRMFAYQEIILEEIINREIQFVTLHDVKAETAEERVLQAMQGVFHEYERVKIVERMRRGKLYKARHGVLINGHSLYGYDYIKKTDKEPAHYRINQEQSRVIDMIFNWFGNEQISLREIIKRLYDQRILPRKGKSEFWTKGPLVRLLGCESYVTGIIHYNKSEAIVAKNPTKHDKYKKVKRSSRRVRPKDDWLPFEVPAILKSRELFDKVQKILDHNKKYARKNRKYDYLLSGLVYCECGIRRAGDGSNSGGHHYYRCAERIYAFPAQKKCTAPGVNAQLLDSFTWKYLYQFLTDPTELKKQAESYLQSQRDDVMTSQEFTKLHSLVVKVEEEEKRYAKAYGAGTLEFEQYLDLMKDAKKRKNIYKEQLSLMSQKVAQDDVNSVSVDELYDEAITVLENLDLSNKNKVVRDIIDKIIIKERSSVEVWGHLTLFNQKLGYEPESRDLHHTVPYLEFEFEFTPPKPRYTRIILQRDEYGRIVHSKSPTISK
jgi:site-specific DNA recombinase